MTIGQGSARRGAAKPLLTGGEKLREAVEVGRGAGGPKSYPVGLREAVDLLQPQAHDVLRQARQIPSEARGRQIIVEATLRPEFLANSYFPAELLARVGATAVGSKFDKGLRRATAASAAKEDARTKTLYIATDDDSLFLLDALLSSPEIYSAADKIQHAVQAIENVSLTHADLFGQFHGTSNMMAAPTPIWEAVLHPERGPGGGIIPASNLTRGRWSEWVRSFGGEANEDWLRESGGLTYVPTSLEQDVLREAQTFNALRSIAPMPVARHSELVHDIEFSQLPIPVADASPARPLRVAVFDGGIDASSPYWAGRVREIELPEVLADQQADDHGALVTSALIYGANPKEPLAPANVSIDHYRVWPRQRHDAFDMYWLLDEILRNVTDNDYQVVVVATAPEKFIEENYVDRWTHALDAVAHERNILFVTAAGNNGEEPSTHGRNQVMLPGDMVNGMTVGGADTTAPKPRRAPFSAVGPGRPGGRVRPDGISFGGTEAEPFQFLRSDGTLASVSGTSASAPAVVHGLADLATRIGPARTSAVSLRAFSAHFALPVARDQNVRDAGHGLLRSEWAFISDEVPNRAHVLYQDVIRRDEVIPLQLPMPDGAADKPVTVRYTLVTSTAVDANNPVEYTKAGLTIRLRPNSYRIAFSIQDGPSSRPRRKILHIVDDALEVERLRRAGWTAAADAATLSPTHRGKSEEKLREEGKWDTLRSFSRTFRPGNLFRPRVELSYLARDSGSLQANAPDMVWALLVTLEGPAGSEMHDLVRAQYPVLAPLPITLAGADIGTTAGSQ